MSRALTPIEINLPADGYSRGTAAEAVRGSRLPETIRQLAAGPFGHTSTGLAVLEALADATDVGLLAAAALEGRIEAEQTQPASFVVTELSPDQRRLVSAFQIVVTADRAEHRIAERCPAPRTEGSLALDGLGDLLAEPDAEKLATRLLRITRGYLDAQRRHHDPSAGPADAFVGTTLLAALRLLREAVLAFAKIGVLRPMVEALAARTVRVAGVPYSGLTQVAAKEAPSGLLPLWPNEIVGNEEYLDAGMRLARDVAAYDFVAGRNPKKINPVLFGLGSPGCGKTVTAHAVGNYFLDYCRAREIRARFVVVRRTDWASSYQNASAANLIRIFREEVYGFDGVCGCYWPDIDTALASRSSTDLRMEEKQNLGAVFGIFDGTLVPRDGRWFLICDANTLHMDEAATSRIAQNPFTVEGPTTVAHYVTLLRDMKLGDLRRFLPDDQGAWDRIGKTARELDLSGRAIEAIANNVRTRIQDFEYPDRYFETVGRERQELLEELSNPVDEEFVLAAMTNWSDFQREAQRREEEALFENEVEAVVRRLNASRAAVERAARDEPDV
jgi:hypothetical protein